MPYKAVKNAFQGADEIALTMAIPRDHKPLRLPTFPNLERTATLATLQTSTMPVASAGVARALVVRSPTYPVWAHTTNASPQSASLDYNFTWQANSTVECQFTSPPEGFMATDLRYLVLGRKNGDVWIYCPKGTYPTCYVVFTNSFTFNLTMSYDVWDGTGIKHLQANTTGTGTSFNVWGPALTAGAWVRFLTLDIAANGNVAACTVQNGWVTGGTMAVPTGALSSIMPVGQPPEFSNSMLPYQSTRSNAVAALFSNVTAVLNKEGTVRATRLPAGLSVRWWGDFDTDVNFTASHPAETYWGPLEKGLYTYTLPDEASVRFKDCVVEFLTDGGTLTYRPCIDLDGFMYVHAIAFTDLTSGDSTLAVTVDSHLEFRTNSALFQLGFSSTSLEAEHIAQMACVRRGVFFENPSHLAAIAGLIRAGVQALAPVAKGAAQMAAAYAGDRILSAARAKLANFTQSNPGGQATTPPGKKKKRQGKGVKATRKVLLLKKSK